MLVEEESNYAIQGKIMILLCEKMFIAIAKNAKGESEISSCVQVSVRGLARMAEHCREYALSSAGPRISCWFCE